jgi:plastocyanin
MLPGYGFMRLSKYTKWIIIITVSLIFIFPGTQTLQNAEAQQERIDNATRVKVGGGNSTDVKMAFIPQTIEIKAGQTINWYNPTPVEEPHSVTFFKDHNYFPPYIAPFAVPATATYDALIPNVNLEPLIVPSNDTTTKTVIIANARSLNPTVVDSMMQIRD